MKSTHSLFDKEAGHKRAPPFLLKLIQVIFQYFNPRFGEGDIIPLCDMNISMPHLIAQQMCGGIFLCHQGSVCVTQIMVLEIDMKPAFDFPRWIFHGVDRLYLPVIQTIHKLR